jgi:translation initiation factor 2B subunit (eIF-2B alpha/beta/delta family)
VKQNFERTKQLLVARGNDFVDSVDSFRDKIAMIGNPFIQDDAVILVHSYSRVVMRLLRRAAADNKRFTVYVTESRPSESGYVVLSMLSVGKFSELNFISSLFALIAQGRLRCYEKEEFLHISF